MGRERVSFGPGVQKEFVGMCGENGRWPGGGGVGGEPGTGGDLQQHRMRQEGLVQIFRVGRQGEGWRLCGLYNRGIVKKVGTEGGGPLWGEIKLSNE